MSARDDKGAERRWLEMPSEVRSGFFKLRTEMVVRTSQRRHDIGWKMLIMHLWKRRGFYLPLLSFSRRVTEKMRAVPYLLPESSLGKVLMKDLYDGKYVCKCDTFTNSINTG